MALIFRDISKSFDSVLALKSFTLEIVANELLVLLGPSGCGKTTALRLLAGLENPDTGDILFYDESWLPKSPQERNVAMVFQQFALYPHRTVRGNIEYPLRLKGLSHEERNEKVKWISSFLRIEKLLDRKPGQLSGGEAQRVALARALVRKPAVFLMDEPLSNLDAQMRTQARAEIKRIQRELKVTTLYVTHDQEEAVALADRIAVMDAGCLVQVGTREELYRKPATTFVARFLGKPPMNLIQSIVAGEQDGKLLVKMKLAEGDSAAVHVNLGTNVKLNSTIIVGLRPEAIQLQGQAGRYEEKSAWSISGEIQLVEGFERDLVVHCETPAGSLLIRTDRRPKDRIVRLILPLEAMYFFDAETNKLLG